MNKKLQVFVSSTYNDMLPERQAAVEAILRAGHIPAGMELFAAGDESQWETIRRWIDDSDVFVLILGGRYGSIEPKSEKSYIQLEYEYAVKKKKPLFAACIADAYLEAKVKSNGTAMLERDNSLKLKEFRSAVTSKICRFFSDINELKLIVFESLANLDRNEDLAGWVRGTDVIDPKTTFEEVARLQAENAELRRQLQDAEVLVALATTQSGGEPSSPADVLSDDAKSLLIAGKAGQGHILYVRYIGGRSIQAAGKNFIEPANDERQHARWKAALEELEVQRLVEGVGYKGETFRLTKRGWEVADALEAQGAPRVNP